MGAAGSTERVAEGGHASKSSAKVCRTKRSKRQLQAEAYMRVQSSSPMAQWNRHGAIVMPTEPADAKNQLRGDPYTPRAPGLDAKLCSTASIKESEGCTRSGIKKSPLVPAGSDVFCQTGTRLRRKSRSPASSAVLRRAGRRFPCSASGSKTGCLRQPSARGATRRCPRPSIRSG